MGTRHARDSGREIDVCMADVVRQFRWYYVVLRSDTRRSRGMRGLRGSLGPHSGFKPSFLLS
jgi:hypothetical protein